MPCGNDVHSPYAGVGCAQGVQGASSRDRCFKGRGDQRQSLWEYGT
jgi:hypothetical protein